MGQAKCFACLTPHQQYILRTYLLALIAMGDTSITGVRALSAASTCFACLTYEELLAAKQYLMAFWLGLDTSKAGIIAQAAAAACDFACLTPKQAEQLRTYLLAVTAGVSTTAAGVRTLEAAAKCFNCLESKQQLEAQVYLLSILAPGAPTTPAAIMQGAKCYLSCVPAELHAALSTSLFAQVANRSTPPCVTPSAPNSVQVAAAHVADPNTELLVRWLQPANSGTLIGGYKVFWGTTAGGPYPNNSGQLPVSPKQYTITGLTAGTTYYVVVQADTSISGCVSANSSEANGTTSGSSTCAAGVTFANAWATQVVANGGAAPSQLTINAIAAFQCGLITDGLDTLMLAWNAIVPDSFTAATTPQLQGTGFALWQPTLLSGADLTINGLTGGAGGSVRYLKTGIAPNAIFPSVNNTGMTLYVFQSQNSANETTMGCGDAGPTNFYTMYDELSGLKYYQEAGAAMTDAGQFNGYISGSRTAANAKAWYKANSVTPHALIASSAAAPVGGMAAQDFWIFTFNQAGVPVAFSSATLSFIAFHKGLTQAQSALFFARIQALRTALGGGFQ